MGNGGFEHVSAGEKGCDEGKRRGKMESVLPHHFA
jgi:hypothetical protein